MNLRSVDLNLLVILDALLAEQSVTRAALRIPLSQPATSLALKRLRVLLKDPLLVRSGAGMALTPRAEALREPLSALLLDISHAIAPERFDPATAHRHFRITATDHAEMVLLPALMPRLAQQAPHVQLVSLSVDALPLAHDDVRKGLVDLTLGYVPQPPEGFHRKVILRERFVCIARRGHPAFKRGMTLEAFLSVRHVLVSPKGGGTQGQVDAALAKSRRARQVALSVSRFSVVPGLVASTDLVATLPANMLQRAEWRRIVDVHELPLPVPGFELMMVWHPRHHASAAHRWLRQLVADVARAEP